jgi:hypothetical protein
VSWHIDPAVPLPAGRHSNEELTSNQQVSPLAHLKGFSLQAPVVISPPDPLPPPPVAAPPLDAVLLEAATLVVP